MEAMTASNTAKISTLLESKVRPLYYEVKTLLDQLIALQLSEARKTNEAAVTFSNRITYVSIVLILLGSAFGMTLGISLINGISRAFGELKNVMVKMSTDNNLTVRCKVFGKGEIGQAASAFNSLIDSFANIITQVNSSTKSVSGTAARTLAATARRFSPPADRAARSPVAC